MADTEDLCTAFQEHKDVFQGELYDYLFSYSLHWNELRSLSRWLDDHATDTSDPRTRDLAQNTTRCIKLLEKDFAALLRAITQRYIRKGPTALLPVAPGPALRPHDLPFASPTSAPALESTRRWNSMMEFAPSSASFRADHTLKTMSMRQASLELSPAPPSSGSGGSGGDLRVVAQVFTDSVELARLDETCFMRDVAHSTQEQELADLWAKEFPARPLVEAGKERRMKPLIRRGVPHALRREVWCATTGARELLRQHPTLYKHAIRETFSTVQGVVDSAASVNLVSKLQGVNPVRVPLFGGKLPHNFPLSDHGIHQVKILLCVVAQNSHVEHCPALPLVLAALLMYLSEPEAYAATRCLLDPGKGDGHDSFTYGYLPTTTLQSRVCGAVLWGLARKKLPQLHRHMKKLEADVEPRLQQWVETMFTELFPIRVILHLLDVFFLEGSKILLRMGLALLKTCEKELLKAQSLTEVDDILGVKLPQMAELQEVLQTAFTFQLKRKEMEELEQHLRGVVKVEGRLRPSGDGLYFRPTLLTKSRVLATDDQWEPLFFWLAKHPEASATQWQLAFSTWRDGFSLGTLYRLCREAGPTVLLIKAIPGSEARRANVGGMEVFGAFNADSLKVSKQYYGTGAGFVFRLSEHPVRWLWAALQSPAPEGPPRDPDDGSPPVEAANHMFLNGYPDRLLVGGGGGGPALELAGDLQSGITRECATYRSPPLCSSGCFDVQHLEVFHFVP